MIQSLKAKHSIRASRKDWKHSEGILYQRRTETQQSTKRILQLQVQCQRGQMALSFQVFRFRPMSFPWTDSTLCGKSLSNVLQHQHLYSLGVSSTTQASPAIIMISQVFLTSKGPSYKQFHLILCLVSVVFRNHQVRIHSLSFLNLFMHPKKIPHRTLKFR